MRIKRLLYAIATILPFLFLCSCYEEQEPQQEKQDKEKWTMQVAGNQLNEFLIRIYGTFTLIRTGMLRRL